MTPAETLTAAATKLRETHAAMVGIYTNPIGAWSDYYTENGDDLGLLAEDVRWIALMPPALAEPLADSLELEAVVEHRVSALTVDGTTRTVCRCGLTWGMRPGGPLPECVRQARALATARAILGEAS